MLTLKKTECAECKPSIWARLAKPITVGASAGSAILSTALVASADNTFTPVTANDWADVTTAVTQQVSVSTVVGVLASCIGACITLVFMWWGARKVVKMLMSAWKRGKLRI